MSLSMRLLLACLLCLTLCPPAAAQSKSEPSDKFRQLEEELPTPNEHRAASGAASCMKKPPARFAVTTPPTPDTSVLSRGEMCPAP